MSRHILVVELDANIQGRLNEGEFLLPEHLDDHEYRLKCPEGNGCIGWIECQQKHEHDGRDASSGPNDCQEDDPWEGWDEFEFHGVLHTWRYGYGWTVPFTKGCIVDYGDWEPPEGAWRLPLGEYEVDDDWDDDYCYLSLTPA